MKRSTTAVLLSALVLPGAGHLYLRHFRRGIALMIISLVCLGIIGGSVMQQASAVLDRLGSEGGALDTGRISDLITQTSSSSGSATTKAATFLLAVCWLLGIVDAYQLGKRVCPPLPRRARGPE
ncbi:MAG TPA: hypothetical protein VEP67_12915 [Thiobacillaceae bacterium]|nr:hypothetical protein [Thiobacillaceae bacterium]